MRISRNEINKVALAVRKFASEKVSFNENEAHDRNNFIVKFNCEDPIKEKFAVNGLLFISIISKCSNSLVLELKDNKLYIYNENSKFSLPLLEYEDNYFIDTKLNYISIREDDIKAVIEKVSFASAKEKSRPILTGINLSLKDCELKATALDGVRLAITRQKIVCNKDYSFNIAIPASDFNGIFDLFNNDELDIGWSESSLFIKQDNVFIRLSILNGDYPNVDMLVKQNKNSNIVKIKRYDLIKAIQLTMFDDERYVLLSIKGDTCKVKNNSDLYETETELDCDNDYNLELNICFRSQYLLDLCFHNSQEKIELNITAELKPLIVDDGVLYQLLAPTKR